MIAFSDLHPLTKSYVIDRYVAVSDLAEAIDQINLETVESYKRNLTKSFEVIYNNKSSYYYAALRLRRYIEGYAICTICRGKTLCKYCDEGYVYSESKVRQGSSNKET